ncbi:MAG: hypothetical protein U0840_27620 [Gemmataceae bacterium]
MFDPYHRWLSIPPDQRPPTYYQLLGIAPGETDTEVIEEAAVRQTTHVRSYQMGRYSEISTAILNEIAQARAVLLHPDKRRDYDARLAPSEPGVAPVEMIEVERVTWPVRPPSPPPGQPPLTRRDGLVLLIGAGCMLVAQVAAVVIVRVGMSLFQALRRGSD